MRKMRLGPAKKYTVDANAAVAVDATPPVPRVSVAFLLVRTNCRLTGGGGGGVGSGEAMSSMSRRQYLR